ncbi:hypothetical protein B566_EDAN012291 [Ephemera danica]|nr:hypothetical protein B566_EDAN012291 [Ephemera danica]
MTSTGGISYPELKEYLQGKLNKAWKEHIVHIYCPTGYTTVPVDWKNCLSKNRTLEQCDKNGGRVTRVTVTTTITPTVAQETEK